jgi:hypothetical protein
MPFPPHVVLRNTPQRVRSSFRSATKKRRRPGGSRVLVRRACVLAECSHILGSAPFSQDGARLRLATRAGLRGRATLNGNAVQTRAAGCPSKSQAPRCPTGKFPRLVQRISSQMRSVQPKCMTGRVPLDGSRSAPAALRVVFRSHGSGGTIHSHEPRRAGPFRLEAPIRTGVMESRHPRSLKRATAWACLRLGLSSLTKLERR